MTKTYSFVGPDVFMNTKGQMFKKASDQQFVLIQNKYTVAEDRYVQKHLHQKGREMK